MLYLHCKDPGTVRAERQAALAPSVQPIPRPRGDCCALAGGHVYYSRQRGDVASFSLRAELHPGR